MKIEPNMVVSLNYKLTNNQTGEKIEETSDERPMEFLYGIERVIPIFEEKINGLEKGDIFDFTVPSADAYGERSEDQVAMIPVSVFHDENGKIDENHIFVGALLPMTDGEGNQLRGRILDILPDNVRMDFNHPLAGTDLHFQGEIVEVREATQDELSHGHSHGAHGHHH